MSPWSRVFCLLFTLAAAPASGVVITVSADGYLDSANPNSNYGGSMALSVSSQSTALLRFGLTALPTGTFSNEIVKATLQVWEIPTSANPVGSISIYKVTSPWTATTVTFNTRPSFASSPIITLATSVTSRYQEIDITPLVKQWIDSPTTNYGLAILPSPSGSTLDILYGSKWNTSGSQPPILDITLKSGKTIAVCLNADFNRLCTCTGTLVSRVSGGSCSATSDTGSCYEMAAGMAANNPIASCCVCAF